MRDVIGQKAARRALEIAACGRHNVLLVGPPGSGKTMLARRFVSLLPPLSPRAQLDVTRIWSAAGLTLSSGGLIEDAPFRAPHHSLSVAALIGGGNPVRPGEVSLAHEGVLFLDELPELSRLCLESLRQPLEDREIVIARARHTVKMPAAFTLIGAANPCPCGWLGDPSRRCRCDVSSTARYARRLSGPLMDRVDMVVQVPAVRANDVLTGALGESSEVIRARIEKARTVARCRDGEMADKPARTSARTHIDLSGEASRVLSSALERMQLSVRGIDRTLRVARTIADLNHESRVGLDSILESLQYRPPKGWQDPAESLAA